MATALFTGFPGFLGTQLLPRVLRRQDHLDAVCLVQRRFRAVAQRRLERLEAEEPTLAGRVQLVDGDVTHPDLGLGERRGSLAARISVVYHLAAVYDLATSREKGMAVNVGGTRHVLALCQAAPGLERLHHVSTCYVSGRWAGIFRETDLSKGQRFNNHYEETKYLAETLVADARADGLPVTVYRPAVVGGDSTTGATQKYDGPYFVLRWLLKQPWIAVMPMVGDAEGYRFNMVPRDFVVDGIDALASRGDTVGGVYALADPEPFTVADLVERLGSCTHRRLLRVPLPRKLAIAALRWVPGLERLMGIPPAAIDYFTHPTHYTTDEADPLLAAEGIRLPGREPWLQAMADFVQAHPNVTSSAMT